MEPSLDFLDYWRARRGIDRTTASAVLGEWLLGAHQARRAAAGVGAFDDTPPGVVLAWQATQRKG